MNERLLNTMLKCGVLLEQYKNILVSVSGGSDSDIVIDIVERVRTKEQNIHYVFVNTGLEYQATLKHLLYLEKKYNITIEKIKGVPIPTVIKKYGVPIKSKEYSNIVDGYCRNLPYAIAKIKRTKGNKKYMLTDSAVELAEYIKEHDIKISNKCCTYSKKAPLHEYIKANNIDLNITGERRAEGGIRATMHKSCFEENNSYFKIAKYMPLFFWTDEDKISYEIDNNIVHSECYTIYGMKRTGCVGCPYNRDLFKDLEIIKQYEPKLYKACLNIFGVSYDLSRRFNIRKDNHI